MPTTPAQSEHRPLRLAVANLFEQSPHPVISVPGVTWTALTLLAESRRLRQCILDISYAAVPTIATNMVHHGNRYGQGKEFRSVILRSALASLPRWWGLLAMVAASVAGFNLMRHLLNIAPQAVIAAVVQIYESLLHEPVFQVISLIGLPRPPRWAIDSVALWLLAGGTVLRSRDPVRTQALEIRRSTTGSVHRQSRALFIVQYLLFWPAALFILWLWPLVYDDQSGLTSSRMRRNGQRPVYDMRVVLAVQLAMTALCVSAWFFLNALIKLYSN